MKKVGILYHPKISAAAALAQNLKETLVSMVTSVWLCSAWEEEEAKGWVEGSELIFSIGGDGTILRAARIVVPQPTPILGINLGRLGFMTELSPEQVRDELPALLAGEGWIDERAMLQAEVASASSQSLNKEEAAFHALNDVVVGRGGISRVIYIKTTIDGELLTTYKADGVIVATATGSTGYSLAVGGPILYPQAKEMLITPIATHLSLGTTLVLPASAKIEFEVSTDHQAILSIDGQINLSLKSGDTVKVSGSSYVARFLRILPQKSSYQTLMRRLSNKHE